MGRKAQSYRIINFSALESLPPHRLKPDFVTTVPSFDDAPPTLIPMAILARLSPERITAVLGATLANPDPARLLMNQFQIFSALGQREFALEMQASALQHSVVYRIESAKPPTLRLLAMLGEGDSSDNTPLDYLIENSEIQLDLLYVLPGQPLPESLPEHDVLMVALGVSDKNRPALQWMDRLLAHWPRPVLNLPQRILNLSRDQVYQQLKAIPNLLISPTRAIHRTELGMVGSNCNSLNNMDYPLTLRPLDSQAGRGLGKVSQAAELADYLAATDEQEFFVSRFVDYQSRDGHYRKWRIALIDGVPYLGHLAISSHWIVHYNTAGMDESAEKRCEEARALVQFETDFALRHRDALRAIAEQLALDYVVLDCAETQDGKLLLFEVDNRGWIHATDPLDLFAYKQLAMQNLFDAFRAMLNNKANAHAN